MFGAIAVGVVLGFFASAKADDKPLIWAPSKLSDTAYAARIGLRLPDYDFASVGAQLGVNSTTVGGPVTTPVILWAKVKMQALQTPASQLDRQVDINVDALKAQIQAQMSYNSRRIVTPDIDLDLKRAVTINYNDALGAWGNIAATQTIRLSNPNAGNAIVISASTNDGLSHIVSGVAVEQRLGKRIRITGGITQQSGNAPAASFNARYNIRW